MKIVRTLLYLLLLAGEYQPQSASVEAHYTPLLAANKQNLLCATNAVLSLHGEPCDDNWNRFCRSGDYLPAFCKTLVYKYWEVNSPGTLEDSEEVPNPRQNVVSHLYIVCM